MLKARLEEMAWMRKKGVYKKITRQEAKRRGMKIVKSRWVDINKGDSVKRNYRSHVVAKEFNNGTEMTEDLFAGTPPLEGVRLLLSEAAIVDDGEVGEKVVVVADVKKAFYEALAKRAMAMELPEEDLTEEERLEGIVGELELAMPGTRDAANSWQEELAKWGKTVGFERSKWSPCLYSDVERRVWMLLTKTICARFGENKNLKYT